MRCAFLTLDDPTGYTIDDHLAVPSLARRGWAVDSVPWRRDGVDWAVYDAVVIRSTWDYVKDADAFLHVLTQITDAGVPLLNPLDLVSWNLRKTYLRDLAARGARIVPTVWRDRLARGELASLIEEVGANEIVVKPVIGASGHGAFRVTTTTTAADVAAIEAHFANRALMAQPFVHAIPTEGEFSLFYFNGEYSHAIQKKPELADFRVQEEHGGSSVAVEETPELLAAGSRVLHALGGVPLQARGGTPCRARGDAPLYARVDLVRANDADGFWLMELELIEPSLYLRTDAKAPGRFARALHERVVTRDSARR